MRNILCFVFLVFCSCNNKPSAGTAVSRNFCDTTALNGVLVFKASDADRERYSMNILNQDLTLYGTIVASEKKEPFLDSLQDKIRAYYPYYYIIHFDAAIKNDSFFCVRIGDETKVIKSNNFLTFLQWPEYISTFSCGTDKSNPLRIAPEDTAAEVEVKDYEALSFKCREVKGDWIKVVCFAACEGCPEDNPGVSGWLRWRKDGALLIKQYYAC